MRNGSTTGELVSTNLANAGVTAACLKPVRQSFPQRIPPSGLPVREEGWQGAGQSQKQTCLEGAGLSVRRKARAARVGSVVVAVHGQVWSGVTGRGSRQTTRVELNQPGFDHVCVASGHATAGGPWT